METEMNKTKIEKNVEEKIEEKEIINVETVKKRKRGRPKSKKINTEPKIAKKRGRKPRIRTPEEIEEEKNKPKRKRGRKIKQQTYSLVKNNDKKKIFAEDDNCLFINLPINITKLNNSINKPSIEEEIFKYKTELPQLPKPYDGPSVSIVNLNDKELKENRFEKYKNVINGNNDDNTEHKIEETKIIEYKLYEKKKSIKKTVRNIMTDFIKHQEFSDTWISGTDISCWWCCHNFNNSPCAIPTKYVNDIFYVYGCFCSFNCALSYNFITNVNKKWERISYLHLLYKKIFNVTEVTLKYAPERECLKMFGGYMNIDEFRNNKNKTFNIVYPPMISIIPQLQETEIIRDSQISTQTHLSKERVNRAEKELKIQRSKPFHKGAIDGLMNMLKITK